jgi:ubiquitin C-terminal hydrolase
MWPRVLVLHIKRFQFNHAARITTKRRESITLSPTLDISRFCAPEMKFCSPELASSRPIYKLRSFVEHLGVDNNGHYITYSRTSDNSWCVFGAALEMPCAGFNKTIIVSPNVQRQMPFLLLNTRISCSSRYL